MPAVEDRHAGVRSNVVQFHEDGEWRDSIWSYTSPYEAFICGRPAMFGGEYGKTWRVVGEDGEVFEWHNRRKKETGDSEVVVSTGNSKLVVPLVTLFFVLAWWFFA